MNSYAWRIQWTLLFFHPISESAEQSWFPFSLAPCPFTYLQRALATLWAESVRLWRVAFSAWWERLLTEVFPLGFFFFFRRDHCSLGDGRLTGLMLATFAWKSISGIKALSNPLTNWIFFFVLFLEHENITFQRDGGEDSTRANGGAKRWMFPVSCKSSNEETWKYVESIL